MKDNEQAELDQTSGKVKVWISAMRLRTLPLAFSCVFTGSAINWQYNAHSWIIFTLSLLTTLFLQILSNLANDYGDHIKGTDNKERVGPTRAMQTGVLSAFSMQKALIVFSALALISGLSLLYVAFQDSNQMSFALLFLLVGLSAIAAAIKYTIGKNPYGYRGLGDLFVFLFFGLVGVCGTAYLHSTTFDLMWLLPAATIGLLSSAVLNLNNLRDHINDAASSKITVVVKIGFDKGKSYQYLLMFFAFVTLLISLTLTTSEYLEYLALLPFILLLGVANTVRKNNEPAKLDPLLKKVALSTFLISCILFITTFI